ncbi:hypothetical protein SEA_UPYO_51 [Gordonia phage Upyo]|nr:hypothetical protein SEA_UPYO_51 [Gordonia phage Upyo]
MAETQLWATATMAGWNRTARGWERPGQLITVARQGGRIVHATLWETSGPARSTSRLVWLASVYRGGSQVAKERTIRDWLSMDRRSVREFYAAKVDA